MQLEIGQIYEGRVKRITEYGAFVEVNGEDAAQKATGMVHISEIANTFVRDIHDFLSESDAVRVKVLAVTPEGKISMSVRQAASDDKPQKSRGRSGKPRVWEPKPVVPQSEMSFEDMMLHFKQCSEEKICALKRGSERRGGAGRRK